MTQLLQEYCQRPKIGNDVMRRDQKYVLLCVTLEQLDPQQRSMSEIEWLVNDIVKILIKLGRAPRRSTDLFETDLGAIADVLHRLAINHAKSRAQEWMSIR
jgi:hypothetical protein